MRWATLLRAYVCRFCARFLACVNVWSLSPFTVSFRLLTDLVWFRLLSRVIFPYNCKKRALSDELLFYQVECCGVYGPDDWTTSDWRNRTISPNDTVVALVPVSCCLNKNKMGCNVGSLTDKPSLALKGKIFVEVGRGCEFMLTYVCTESACYLVVV